MVNPVNIMEEHSKLTEEQELVLRYGGDNETRILFDDTIAMCNGDLKVSRTKPNCTVYVDCAKVKYMYTHERWF